MTAIKHYLQFSDFTADEYAYVLERAALIKKKFKGYEKHHTLSDRTLAMIFEKASRSEEHTSELQSQSNLVCRLLLEKKKKQSQDSNVDTVTCNTRHKQ